MAIAIPDSATMFASTPVYRMMINAAKTAIGNKLEIIAEARRLNTKTITTIIQINISCVNAVSSVPTVSLIKPERS